MPQLRSGVWGLNGKHNYPRCRFRLFDCYTTRDISDSLKSPSGGYFFSGLIWSLGGSLEVAKISPLLLGVTISIASCSAASQASRDASTCQESSPDAASQPAIARAVERQAISARPTGNHKQFELSSISPRQMFVTGTSVAADAQSRNSKPVESKRRKGKENEQAVSNSLPR